MEAYGETEESILTCWPQAFMLLHGDTVNINATPSSVCGHG